jgi:hypothetical protein
LWHEKQLCFRSRIASESFEPVSPPPGAAATAIPANANSAAAASANAGAAVLEAEYGPRLVIGRWEIKRL